MKDAKTTELPEYLNSVARKLEKESKSIIESGKEGMVDFLAMLYNSYRDITGQGTDSKKAPEKAPEKKPLPDQFIRDEASNAALRTKTGDDELPMISDSMIHELGVSLNTIIPRFSEIFKKIFDPEQLSGTLNEALKELGINASYTAESIKAMNEGELEEMLYRIDQFREKLAQRSTEKGIIANQILDKSIVILRKRLVELVDSTRPQQVSNKWKPSEAALKSADQATNTMMDTLKGSLAAAISGKGGKHLRNIMDAFTAQIVKLFSDSLVESFMDASGLKQIMKDFFTNVFSGGEVIGGGKDGKTGGLGGLLGGMFKTTPKPDYTGGIAPEEAGAGAMKGFAEYKDPNIPVKGFFDSISGTFETGFDKLKSVTKGLFTSDFIESMMAGLKGMGKMLIDGAKAIMAMFGFSNGGAIYNGKVMPFALGGIVYKPTIFPMAKGMGLMGEAGPEGILPLTRVNGKLGVNAKNMGESKQQVFNINITGDVSRQTRSEIQKMLPNIASGVNKYNFEQGNSR